MQTAQAQRADVDAANGVRTGQLQPIRRARSFTLGPLGDQESGAAREPAGGDRRTAWLDGSSH